VLLLLAVISSTAFPSGIPFFLSRGLQSYIALVPQTLYAGEMEAVSLTLWEGDHLVSSPVEVALLKEGKEVFQVSGVIAGRGNLKFTVPELEPGEYELEVRGTGFRDRTKVAVRRSLIVFLETDKPIYKPGQTLHARIITLNSELKPVSQKVTVEIVDAKGIKIFRQQVNTDEYGMAAVDLPLSREPNLGVWKVTAIAGETRVQRDVRVEKYVLPKFEIRVELPREWFLVTEPVQGRIAAEYSFGKPVKGELEIKASRYVGAWEEYATFTTEIDGEAEFRLPAVQYVAGVPAAGGKGNIMLDITVREKATGYEEKVNRLLTVAASSLSIQIIPESSVFKPSLPFGFLIVTETPDNKPVETTAKVNLIYLNQGLRQEDQEQHEVTTEGGKALVEVTPPEGSVALIIEVLAEGSSAYKALQASYSPSGNFIHVEQVSPGIPRVGEEVRFKVYSTREAANFYYEVISRGRMVFSDFTSSDEITFTTTPLMTPSARLLVYQILPNSEVAADYMPFEVEAEYPHQVMVRFSQEEATPGEELEIQVETEGEAKVGIVAVDRSVYILAEKRLNLQQVFAELERLYLKPRAELHPYSVYSRIATKGAKEIFADAGLAVLSNRKIPEGKDFQRKPGFWEEIAGFLNLRGFLSRSAVQFGLAPPMEADTGEPGEELAEVERVRQYFPETWLWQELLTDASGKATLRVTTPDSITIWKLQAVALSREKGLGIAEDELRAFQPFFAQIDLPYSAIRGEEFPVKVAVYNYLREPQEVTVEIEPGEWFELLDNPAKTIVVEASDIGGVEFQIRPEKLGVGEVKVTARSKDAADALVKTIIVQPEGVEREIVENFILSAGASRTVSTLIPSAVVAGSERAYIAVTSSYLTQTIEGLDALLKMPFGCGEQNMILFAPDVYITRYLKETGQLKPEIMAKAEKLMITGYQRELTYMRSDGSFSAFGDQDREGSLWLTAFVLKTFAQARDLIYIDEDVLNKAKSWIVARQQDDGSFESIGFVHHQGMMGGVKGKKALTAYVAIALREAGEERASARAVSYLEGKLEEINDAYTMALVTYALELAGSEKKDEAYGRLMELAIEDEGGLHWGTAGETGREGFFGGSPSTQIEATAYATLALLQHGDGLNAGRAAKWLVSRRNAFGGFGSTQDTVVALQALTEYSRGAGADVDLKLSIEAAGVKKELSVGKENFDLLQIVEVPVDEAIEIKAQGEGEVVVQVVQRFNLPQPEEEEQQVLNLKVRYYADQVEVDDRVTVAVELEFNPVVSMEAGMVVLDVAVPTGFAPVVSSIEEVVAAEGGLKRYDVAGRKVIFYIENMLPGERIAFNFDIKAVYPVRAKGVSSQAYSYYKPEIRGETLSQEMVILP
jgi:CD109 antigen